MKETKSLIKCKCPKCGKIYNCKLKIFNHNPDKLFRKFCSECEYLSKNISPFDIETGEIKMQPHHQLKYEN